MDEELAAYVRRQTQPLVVSDETINVEGIIKVGGGGSFLTQRDTMKLCRTAFLPPVIFNKYDHAGWSKAGSRDLIQRSQAEIDRRLECFKPPDMSPNLARELERQIQKCRRS
jgi:trimethylamine--corrinoid protein Co-methyltransferase